MKVKFWGVRGSIACPGPDTVHYGGNTPCLELFFDDIDRIIIIDAGSGIRPLGYDLKKRCYPADPFKADIFLSHTHWDHIMGFPFSIRFTCQTPPSIFMDPSHTRKTPWGKSSAISSVIAISR